MVYYFVICQQKFKNIMIEEQISTDRLNCFRKCLQILYLYDMYKKDSKYAKQLNSDEQQFDQSEHSDDVSLRVFSSKQVKERKSRYIPQQGQNLSAFESIEQKPQNQQQRRQKYQHTTNQVFKRNDKTPDFKQHKFNTLASQNKNYILRRQSIPNSLHLDLIRHNKRNVKKHDCSQKIILNNKKTRLQQIMDIRVKKPSYRAKHHERNINLTVQRVLDGNMGTEQKYHQNRYEQCRKMCSEICKKFQETLANNDQRNSEIISKYGSINIKKSKKVY